MEFATVAWIIQQNILNIRSIVTKMSFDIDGGESNDAIREGELNLNLLL